MSDRCPKCGKRVYFAEQLTFMNQYWHKQCFKCGGCQRRINTSAEASDNNGVPYCSSCYKKIFGPKGYGFHGGAGAGVMVASTDKVVDSIKNEKLSKEELQENIKAATFSYLKNSNERSSRSFNKLDGRDRSGYDQSKKHEETQKEKKKKSRFGGAPKCPVCGKSVYFAEQMKALGETFHKSCFKCTDCGKGFNIAGDAVDGQGLLYCKACYGKKFGPKGIGFGTLNNTGIDRKALRDSDDESDL